MNETRRPDAHAMMKLDSRCGEIQTVIRRRDRATGNSAETANHAHIWYINQEVPGQMRSEGCCWTSLPCYLPLFYPPLDSVLYW